jgi:hypothetical protein
MATGCETERQGLQILPHAIFRQAPEPSLSYSTGYDRGGRGEVVWVGSDLTGHLILVSLVTSCLDTILDNSLTEVKAHIPWQTGTNGVYSLHCILYSVQCTLCP